MTLRSLAIAFLSMTLSWATITPTRAAEGEFDRDGTYKTANFSVKAADRALAEKFGDMAEHYRREKAIEWTGREMAPWPQRCPLRVEINLRQSGGATTFSFHPTRGVLSQEMKIWGETKQLLYSVLPHEVTHTVFAHHFQQAVPRWADEGGSVLSENEDEWFNHDIRCREILNAGRGIHLRVLFTLKEYPRDMIVVYAQGYSLCDYLINKHGGRRKFLQFVGIGMQNDNRNWEAAIREVYGFENVDDLEERWIESLRTPPQRLIAKGQGRVGSTLASRPDVRSSGLASAVKLEPSSMARGQSSNDDTRARRTPPTTRPVARPTDAPPPIPLLGAPEPINR